MCDAEDPIQALLRSPLQVINIGLSEFTSDLRSQEIEVIDVDWSPPAGGNPKLVELLSRLGV